MNKRVKLNIGLGVLMLLGMGGMAAYWFLDQASTRILPKPLVTRALLGPARGKSKVVPGGLHLVILADDGSLWGVGCNNFGQAGGTSGGWTTQFKQFQGGSDWIDAAALNDATIALRRDGTLWQWGTIAGGPVISPASAPAQIGTASAPAQIGTASNWLAVSGNIHQTALARQDDGTLWTWGHNGNCEFGSANIGSRATPGLLNSDRDWAYAFCGEFSSVGIKTNGTLWVWGHLYAGTYPGSGIGRFSDLGVRGPFQAGDKTGWITAQCQWSGIVAQQRDGSLWRLDLGDLKGQTNWTRLPDVPNGLSSWSAAELSLIAVDSKGGTWVMGQNWFGMLARRFTRSSDAWLPVETIGGVTAAGGVCGGAALIKTNGEVFAWGRRYDDSSGDVVGLSDRARLSLAQYWPSLAPKNVGRMPAYEVTAWKPLEFVRINGVNNADHDRSSPH